jgi:hypothetical protein
VQCQTASGTAACACKTNNACGFNAATTDTARWTALVDRMRQIYPELTAANIVVDYDWSGLGYAGDPNGPDISPLVTVSLRNVVFEPMILQMFGIDLPIPASRYALTMEDAKGAESN